MRIGEYWRYRITCATTGRWKIWRLELNANVVRHTDYVNFLLIMVPFGIIAGQLHWNPSAVFALNFFAIIPLAAVLSFATEEISMKLGEALGGLLNATFGNAVELIVRWNLPCDDRVSQHDTSMIDTTWIWIKRRLEVRGMLTGCCNRSALSP